MEAITRSAWAQEVPQPVSMAMHVHSSFSEGTASMNAQLAEAQAMDVDVVWWTDHDWRAMGHGYRSVVHFSGFTETENGNDPLIWIQSRTGSLSSSSATIDPSRVSPSDPAATSSLRLAATGSTTSYAFMRVTADSSKARDNLRGTIGGQVLTFDVFPESISKNVFLELKIKLSKQPAAGGRVAGSYSIVYRVGGSDAPGDPPGCWTGGLCRANGPGGSVDHADP